MLYQHYRYKASKLIQGSYAAQKNHKHQLGRGENPQEIQKKWWDKTFAGVPESFNKTNPFLKVEKKNEKDENPQDKNAQNHGWWRPDKTCATHKNPR